MASPISRSKDRIGCSIAAGATPAQFKMMIRNMLIERFGMKVQHETKDLTVYVLTIAKKGCKLEERPSPQAH